MRFAFLIEPPFNFIDGAGRVTGSDVELARMALASAGFSDAQFIATEFSELLPGLQRRRWDMTTGLFVTEERRKIVRFSNPIWSMRDALLVRAGNPENIGSLSDFSARSLRLAVIAGQVQYSRALEAGVPVSNVSIFPTYDAAAEAVRSGDVVAYLSVSLAHHGFIRQSRSREFAVCELADRAASAGAFGFALDNERMPALVNRFLDRYLGTPEHLSLLHRFEMDGASP